MINSKLKALTSVKPGATPCSSPESSPRTSDSDIEVLFQLYLCYSTLLFVCICHLFVNSVEFRRVAHDRFYR